MSDTILSGLDVTNFRSIRGHVHAPLDAKVVLIHGENGAGKTSLLSAIEYGLTGNVQALHRADPSYARHLLHRSTEAGTIVVKTLNHGETRTYEAVLNQSGARSVTKLAEKDAAFFAERAYLPQSLLSQLLQIYQESGSNADSPLAKFVGDLLGLDRLDALEAGLKPLHDVRNVRKVVQQWSEVESERERSEKLVNDQKPLLTSTTQSLHAALSELNTICNALGLKHEVNENTLEAISPDLRSGDDEKLYEQILDGQRRLGAIKREIASADERSEQPLSQSESEATAIRAAYSKWDAANSQELLRLRSKVSELIPLVKLSSNHLALPQEAMGPLQSEHREVTGRAEQGRQDLKRILEVQREIDAGRTGISIIDMEIVQISSNSEVLASVLGELTSHIQTEACPVCDRDFSELEAGSLRDHVQHKIARLSASAARLITLGKTRGEGQQAISRLEGELRTIDGRKISPEILADLDRRSASLASTIAELERLIPVLSEGADLQAKDVSYLRRANELQSSNSALIAARETVSDFAIAIGADAVGPEEGFQLAVERLEAFLREQAERLSSRLSQRRKGLELTASIGPITVRIADIKRTIANSEAESERTAKALQRAQALRDQGLKIRDTVDGVRSAIIRRVFNDQLNRVWRDLFVRLAPSEPFVPAFSIPVAETKGIQPKLVTVHRDSGESAGTPGAMLSAGNLNTAALTLFIALHLSVPKALPWLILDDPVQSMDDIHKAHFAALLRTLSKEHDRQVIIAVHDRQLFEYLKLELSPAFPDDSLVTLELVRGPMRDTHCFLDRPEFREETALLATA